MTQFRFTAVCSFAIATLLLASPARAQVAPLQYWIPGGAFGFGGNVETQNWGATPDEDGFRKGFSFRSYSVPVTSFANGLSYGGFGAFGSSGLAANSAQYNYSFKGLGDTPVTLFGEVNSLRTTPDVFTSLTNPGFDNGRNLATSFNAGIAFKPASNISLSLSAGVVQPSPAADMDLRSQLISGTRR